MKDQLENYVKLVKERYQKCSGNEATTKAVLIAPLFGILGYDMADPSECFPEFRADFGQGAKAATPVDWAFCLNSAFVFVVEAKAADKKLKPYAEQLGMYFVKVAVPLGIYTNGVQWQFYADLEALHIMDKKPFFTWDVLNDDPAIALGLLTILQRSKFNAQLVKTFAEGKRHHSLLVEALNYLLEPSPEFIKLAVKIPDRPIETGVVTQARLEAWKPILASAIHEWAKQRALMGALQRNDPAPEPVGDRDLPDPPKDKVTYPASLQDIIRANLVPVPCTLFKEYKGKTMEAAMRLEATLRPDGTVEFERKMYDSCSSAAAAALSKATGQDRTASGWIFWQFTDKDGKNKTALRAFVWVK